MKRKTKIISKLQRGDIILIDNKKFNLISIGIKWFTSSRFNHACIYVGNSRIAHFTGLYGARYDKIGIFTKKRYKMAVMRHNGGLTSFEKPALDAVIKYSIDESQDYDHISIVGSAILSLLEKIGINLWKYKNPLDSEGNQCLTGIDMWYKQIGLDLFPDIGSGNPSPQDAYECKELVRIYEEE